MRLGISHVPEGRRVFPGLTVAVTVVAINLYGDALIATLDIRARLRREA